MLLTLLLFSDPLRWKLDSNTFYFSLKIITCNLTQKDIKKLRKNVSREVMSGTSHLDVRTPVNKGFGFSIVCFFFKRFELPAPLICYLHPIVYGKCEKCRVMVHIFTQSKVCHWRCWLCLLFNFPEGYGNLEGGGVENKGSSGIVIL